MVATTADMAQLATDATFQARVRSELAIQCQNVATEAITTANLLLHVRRATFAAQILQNLLSASPNWAQIFAETVATDTTVIADATASGTIVLDGTNTSTRQASVTDAHIGNAISAQFNGFLQPT